MKVSENRTETDYKSFSEHESVSIITHINPNIAPNISVIIPLHNRKNMISRALNSVLNQTVLPCEILICDDGSDDAPQSVMADLRNANTEIKWLRTEKCCGVSHARNRGIAAAKGEFIAFLDSDDEWLPKKSELQLNFFRQNPQFNIIHCDEIWIRNAVRVNPKAKFRKAGGDIFERSVDFSLIAPSAVMARREIFDTYGVFDENLPVCEDYDLWLRIMLGNEEFGFIPTALVTRYAGHDGQLSKRYEAMDKFRAKSLYNLLQTQNIPEDKRKIMQKVLHQKAQVLLNGAQKRGHHDDVPVFRSYLDT